MQSMLERVDSRHSGVRKGVTRMAFMVLYEEGPAFDRFISDVGSFWEEPNADPATMLTAYARTKGVPVIAGRLDDGPDLRAVLSLLSSASPVLQDVAPTRPRPALAEDGRQQAG